MEKIFNLNGVLYVLRENENGFYMQRVNPDGSNWVDAPQLTKEEIATGIVAGPVKIDVMQKRKPWYRRIFNR